MMMATSAMECSPLDPTPSSDFREQLFASSPVQESHPLSTPKHDPFEEEFSVPFPDTTHDDDTDREDTAQDSNEREDLFVEPPSYADVIFTPYVGDPTLSLAELGDALPLLTTSSHFPDYLNITVSEPQKVQANEGTSIVPGSKYYVTYLIVTRTNIPEYGGNDFAVRRRFRDVVTLADRLAEKYRGYLIPCRPLKNVVESQVMQKQEFIEQRKIALEKYLGRLANHPVIRMSEELRLFLQSQEKLPLIPTMDMVSSVLGGAANLPRQLFGEGSTIISPQDVAQPAKGGRDLVRLFKELRQSVTIDWGRVKPALNEEDEFLERKEQLFDLEHELSEASQQAEAVVTAQQEIGETIGELGLGFIKIAKFETESAVYNAQRTHAADAKRLATAAVKASRFYREANAQLSKHLDKVHEYHSLMQSVHAAFNDRSNALLTVQTLMTELSSISTRIEKLTVASSKIFGGDASRNRKVEELKEGLKTTEEAHDSALREYECIKENNQRELERFDHERHRDFLEMLRGFVHSQVGYAEKIANVWSRVAEDFNPDDARLPESPNFSSPRLS